ncbi:MAG: bifunctional pyr operon transcriptional regulator/uracil phosphoribosyltransferase PyrR [Clostridia bacterium]|nr:bifunctional pyr operon transcriptional regulator/uracil phosphoribosyltransferase PyrR [Clostridia bacterium]
MELKSEIMTEAEVARSLARITHEMIERNHGTDNIVLLGIRRRGLPLARHIAANMKRFEDAEVPVGYIDVTLYRDDLTEITNLPDAGETHIPCDLNGKCCILVDDVIFTGRTARAAIEAVFKYGRPALIQLAVLIDRGHRELPIRPDFVGKNIPTARSELIAVTVPEIDMEPYGVKLYER